MEIVHDLCAYHFWSCHLTNSHHKKAVEMRMCTVVDASEFAILYCGDEASKSERKEEMEWNGMGKGMATATTVMVLYTS